MLNKFQQISAQISFLLNDWEPKLLNIDAEVLSIAKNKQDRTIKQILGHMIDSASNNIHRMVHLQYQESPLRFPNYATKGNNDKWIAIQNYQEESWDLLVKLWASVNRHIAHLIRQVDASKLDQVWISALGEEVSLQDMIKDYPRHFKLHLDEITELL